MADPIYRGFSIFAGTKKVADFMDADYEIVSNGETIYADVDGGVAGYSKGAVEASITASAVVPVAGMVYNFEQQLVVQNDIDLGIGIVNGKIHQTRGRVMRAKFTTDVKTGILKGEFQIRALMPQITG